MMADVIYAGTLREIGTDAGVLRYDEAGPNRYAAVLALLLRKDGGVPSID
jgi:hypothetical protein